MNRREFGMVAAGSLSLTLSTEARDEIPTRRDTIFWRLDPPTYVPINPCDVRKGDNIVHRRGSYVREVEAFRPIPVQDDTVGRVFSLEFRADGSTKGTIRSNKDKWKVYTEAVRGLDGTRVDMPEKGFVMGNTTLVAGGDRGDQWILFKKYPACGMIPEVVVIQKECYTLPWVALHKL